MADLTKAMQGAAETAKADTLARFTADAKAHIESIHASTAVEATELRKQADDDVAAHPRVVQGRDRPDPRGDRRAHHPSQGRLEREIEAHAAEIEARIERVQRARRRLRGRDGRVLRAPAGRGGPDPLRRHGREPARAAALRYRDVEDRRWPRRPSPRQPVPRPTTSLPSAPSSSSPGPRPRPRPTETVDAPEAGTPTRPRPPPKPLPIRRSRRPPTRPSRPTPSRPSADEQATCSHRAAEADAEAEASDPRLDALGLEPGLRRRGGRGRRIHARGRSGRGDHRHRRRRAGGPPGRPRARRRCPCQRRRTRPASSSPASSASRASPASSASCPASRGVHSVGVSSGPDGEFLFAVTHDSAIVLKDAVTTLPGFGARVTAEAEGELTVTAKRSRGRGLIVARPSIAIALPPEESVPVAAELREAGFTVTTVSPPRRARGAAREHSRRRRRDPRRRDRLRPARSSTTGCCATPAAPSRR